MQLQNLVWLLFSSSVFILYLAVMSDTDIFTKGFDVKNIKHNSDKLWTFGRYILVSYKVPQDRYGLIVDTSVQAITINRCPNSGILNSSFPFSNHVISHY
ncbi:hypothetical protein VNO77_21341 [Canavalia gladiata]|uniref:Uncharacterized protein n=1 Tax=Canavalia gladiata TaxID=3824 RepID=A0AAN9LR42_CANGL